MMELQVLRYIQTYDDMLTDDEIFQVLKEAKKDGIVIAVHCRE